MSKLNGKITSEKALAETELRKIGEYYYGQFLSGGQIEPEILEACQSAKALTMRLHMHSWRLTESARRKQRRLSRRPRQVLFAHPAGQRTQREQNFAGNVEQNWWQSPLLYAHNAGRLRNRE